MSYSAVRFPSSVRFAQSLQEDLSELGYLYDGRKVHDLVGDEVREDDRKVHQTDISRIAQMSQEEFFAYILPLSRGAKYIAGRIYDKCSVPWDQEHAIASIDLKQLASDWAAKKELTACLSSMVTKEALDYLGLGDNGYAKLMNMGIRFDWQAYRFLQLYKEVCNPNRPTTGAKDGGVLWCIPVLLYRTWLNLFKSSHSTKSRFRGSASCFIQGSRLLLVHRRNSGVAHPSNP